MARRALLLCALAAGAAAPAVSAEGPAFGYNRLLGRGMNLAGELESAKVGEWGITFRPEYFKEIKKAGFESIRIPVRWDSHALPGPPYTLDPVFLKRVDWTVNQALAQGLRVVIDMHSYEDMSTAPDKNLPRAVGMWKQIAEHYRTYPESLYFELLNEPHDQLTDEKWQDVFPELLHAVRQSNPKRMVVIGPAYWNSIDHLAGLSLPADDNKIIVTVHYYVPLQFTHQGAGWMAGSDKWKGTTWAGSANDVAVLQNDFAKAAAWAQQNDRPIYLGEFGAYQAAEMQARARWTHAVADEAQKNGFSWSYWEFCGAFGAYDPGAMAWRAPLLDALRTDAGAKN